jgi:rod shape-determining protein MreC
MSGLITTRSTRVARRRAIVYAGLIGLSVALMAASSMPAVHELQAGVGFAFRPFQQTIAGIASNVGSVVDSIQNIDRLRTANRDLQAENDRLRVDNERLKALQPEIDQLTTLLQVKNGFKYHTIAAAVIARERPEVGRIMTIDRGTSDGLMVGDVVVSAGGALAGRIVDASSSTAHVTLINDPKSTVTGMIEVSRATGEVTGQLGGVLQMTNIDSTERVSIGDQVVTAGIVLGSGIRSPYPKGLPIGNVFDVQRDANAVVQTAYVAPLIDLNKLEYVLVITDYRGGLPPTTPQSPAPASPSPSKAP